MSVRTMGFRSTVRAQALRAMTGITALVATLVVSPAGLSPAAAEQPASAPATVDAEYAEQWRPQFHYSRPSGFMNDPNGLVYFDGEYHMFYQARGLPGGIGWGHAVSTDLVHWQTLPIAIPPADGVSIFSGSVVVDYANTSGFGSPGNPAMVAIYSGNSRVTGQDQRLAYSLDHGRTWVSYSGNPVLTLGLTQFRDPNVFWYPPTRRWVMVVAFAQLHQVGIFSSPDLKQWRLESRFGPLGEANGVWECPALMPFQLDDNPRKTRWVMIVSTNPGGQYGGSGTQYFVGDFDGGTFTADPNRYTYTPPGGTVLADFEKPSYGPGWTTTGTAFGNGPVAEPAGPAVPVQGIVPFYGFTGKRLVDSSAPNPDGTASNALTGTLTSRPFVINKAHLNLEVGGTNSATTQVQLLVNGTVVRSASGNRGNVLDWVSWDLSDLRGQTAQLQVIDDSTTGAIAVDHVMLANRAATSATQRAPWQDWGADDYAGIPFNNLPGGRTLYVGWLENWLYAQNSQKPTSAIWTGQQSEPRELSLRTVAGVPNTHPATHSRTGLPARTPPLHQRP